MISWDRALWLEHEVFSIIQKQKQYGVLFDKGKAIQYVSDIEKIQLDIYNDIRPLFEFDVDVLESKIEGQYNYLKRIFTLKGEYTSYVKKYFPDVDETRLVGGPFTRIKFIEPDFNKRLNVIKQLLRYGWKPKEFTEKGQPKITVKGEPVDSLIKMEHPFGKLLATWYTYEHRKNTIKGWIRDCRDDGRLTADANTLGTPTARFRHKIVVNVPKAKDSVIFGKEMRSLFIVPDDSYMLGYDAAGLEARMEAHYTFPFDDGKYANEILNGDIHTKNMEWISYYHKIDRDEAKNIKYALTYGAYPKKIRSMIGCTMKVAEKIFDEYWKQNDALGKLRKKILKFLEKHDYLPGLDGRKIYVKSEHSALNYLFQSGGAISMKTAMVLLEYYIQEYGIEGANKIIDMHDEGQYELFKDLVVLTSDIPEENHSQLILSADGKYYSFVGELSVRAVVQSGEKLKLRCPLDAEYKIGRNWSETH